MADIDLTKAIEAATRARMQAQHPDYPISGATWEALRSRVEVEWMRTAIEAALPELRAALAEQVEAAGREEVQWLADHAQDDARDRARLIGAEEAWRSALRIIRGAS